MELVKRNLHQMCRKSEAVSQVTFDEDFNVPDAKPDVGRMIQKKGDVQIADVQVSEGKARVFGGLTFHLLYVADDEGRRVYSLGGVCSSICCASLPIAYSLSVLDSKAMILGSSRTTWSSLKITVLAVPRSIANSCLKKAI